MKTSSQRALRREGVGALTRPPREKTRPPNCVRFVAAETIRQTHTAQQDLHGAVPDTDALYAVVIDRLTERPEIADVNTSVVYEHLRNHVIEPLG